MGRIRVDYCQTEPSDFCGHVHAFHFTLVYLAVIRRSDKYLDHRLPDRYTPGSVCKALRKENDECRKT